MLHLAASPSLTIALALLAGVIAQAIAHYLRIPGIILLLATGVALGPDGIRLLDPEALGTSLHSIVGFAVAVILFEGAMNLQWKRLAREARSIRQLVLLGSFVTAVGGAAAAHRILGWGLTQSILFGSLVTVTGPTVINPLLRRIRVKQRVATVLSAEGILIDAFGAILAVVVLELMLAPGQGLAGGALSAVWRLLFGALVGVASGGLLVLLLRGAVPEGLENAFSLAFAIGTFQIGNALLGETGIVAVIVAGLTVGNVRSKPLTDLKEFKEQITLLLLGLLFVLLAADVRVAEVAALGWPGVLTVLFLMLVVRPVNVWVSSIGTDLTLKEKLFISWLAPRGIVAAAVSSLFAQTLDAEGMRGGSELRALVFLLIAMTVVIQGLTGGFVARLLDLRRDRRGFAILGANALGRALARVSTECGEESVLIDTNPIACRAAEEQKLRVLYGNGLSELVMQRAGMEHKAASLAVTTNDEVNLLHVRAARKEFHVATAMIAVRTKQSSVTPELLERDGVGTLFGAPRPLDVWISRLEANEAEVQRWQKVAKGGDALLADEELLPILVRRGARLRPVGEKTKIEAGDEVFLVLESRRSAELQARLVAMGFTRADALPVAV